MNKLAKYLLHFANFLVVLALALSVNFVMPSYHQTIITGMEVKRMDKDGLITKQNPADGPVRDVYFLFTKELDSDKIKVYRNEDTRFDFPYYFKFDSANLQANAQQYINDRSKVEIKYYGWRITYFDEFPNALRIDPIDGRGSLPIVSYIIYSLLFVFWVWATVLVNRRFKDQKWTKLQKPEK